MQNDTATMVGRTSLQYGRFAKRPFVTEDANGVVNPDLEKLAVAHARVLQSCAPSGVTTNTPNYLEMLCDCGDEQFADEALLGEAKASESEAKTLGENEELDEAVAEAAASLEAQYAAQMQKGVKKKQSFLHKLPFLKKSNASDQTLLVLNLEQCEKLIKSQKNASELLQGWGKSFDALLQDRLGVQLFRAYLRTEISDENIEFWLACEDFKKQANERKLVAKAQRIYTEFIAVQAPREINIDSKTRLMTIQNLANPHVHALEQAQKRIQALMFKDSYQRFLRSEVYSRLVKECSKGKTQGSGGGPGAAAGAVAATDA